jgi:predicted DNA-binding transcriptional regulator AlpA
MSKSRVEKFEVLTEIDAAKYIGMSRSFLRQDRMNGFRERRTRGPVFIRIGRQIRYHVADLDAWLDEHRVRRTIE